jgi:hypothetical protein
MELAVRQGLDVRVVTLPPGQDPADAADEFEGRLGGAESYVGYRVRLELERAPDRQSAHERVREFLDGVPESPERQEAWRHANDRLGMTVQLQSAVSTMKGAPVSRRVMDAGDRLERDVLAACIAFPALHEELREMPAENFDNEIHRRLRAVILKEDSGDEVVVAELAELDAIAAAEGIDQETARQLFLRLQARQLQRELQRAEPSELKELQERLIKVRQEADLAH